jgi:hypothetical protein
LNPETESIKRIVAKVAPAEKKTIKQQKTE